MSLSKSQFKDLFDTHYKEIKNFLYYKTADVALSEDLAQECFMKIWQQRDKVKSATAKNYMYTVAKNLAIDHIKKKQSFFHFMSRKVNDENKETPLFVLEEKEFDERLQRAISSLSEKQRTVFLMNRIDDLTYVEIAERIGISVKGVEKRMMLALKALKDQIKV